MSEQTLFREPQHGTDFGQTLQNLVDVWDDVGGGGTNIHTAVLVQGGRGVQEGDKKGVRCFYRRDCKHQWMVMQIVR